MEGTMLNISSPSVPNFPARGLAGAGEFVYSPDMGYSISHVSVSVAVSLRLLLP